MTVASNRLVAVAISPLSYLGVAPPSAIEVVHQLRFSQVDGKSCREARLRLSVDKSTITLSMRNSGISRRSVEMWRLTDRDSAHRSLEPRRADGDGFVMVILQRLREASDEGSWSLDFDLSKAGTMSGCIDVADLRRLGFDVPDARQWVVEGMALAPVAPAGPEQPVRQSPPARPRRRSSAGDGGVRRRVQGSVRKTKLHTGAFATRQELTARIWALHRQQVFPNLAAIARECAISAEVVRAVVEKQEGLETYLQTGCLLG